MMTIWDEWKYTYASKYDHAAGNEFDMTGLSVTTWVVCGVCGKKLNQKTKFEVLRGFHSHCSNLTKDHLVKCDGMLVLQSEDHQLRLWIKKD